MEVPDHYVADGDVVARQRLAALDGADGKAGEVVVGALVHSRHLGRLATDQRAPRHPAALDNTGDHRFGGCHIELADREVVEEEQRLGALDEEIVDAHGDEIDADRGVPAGVDGDPELGADPVVGGDEDRIAEAGPLEVEEAAEAAEIGIGAGPAGRA